MSRKLNDDFDISDLGKVVDEALLVGRRVRLGCVPVQNLLAHLLWQDKLNLSHDNIRQIQGVH